MEVNKDIGDGIKHRLKDLHKAPDVMVWPKIEADLKKKKKRRLLFFLLPIIGLSVLLLFFFTINKDTKGTTINTHTISNTSTKKVETKLNSTIINKKLNGTISNKNSVTIDSNTISNTSTKQNNVLKNSNNTFSNNNYSSSSSSQLKDNTTIPTNTNSYIVSNKTNNITPFSTTTEDKTTTNQKLMVTDSLKTNSDTTDLLSLKKQEDSISKKQLLKQTNIVKTDSTDNKTIKRWSITPYVSIDYFSSLNHATKNNTSTNYGVKLSYLATEDISLRLGVAKLDLNFTSDEDSFNFTEKISYYEIPLEVKQRVFKGKANTSIIAGVSYLLLDKATLYTNGIENNLQIETIENTNMSVNLGLSFDTLIIKKLHFVLEPIFKYHFKPLENRLDSKTYTLSILGGLEYKF